MGTITVNNKDEFYVTDSKMEGLVRWLRSHAVLSPTHFMDGKASRINGALGVPRPLCGAHSSHGTTDQDKVTCTGCREQLEQATTKNRMRKEEASRPPKPQLPPNRIIREDEDPRKSDFGRKPRVSARRPKL